MSEPVWLEYDALIALHDASIVEHGGAPRLRDEGLLRSALARPQNLFLYENVEDIARLAACYAYGVAKNHAFVDGNKRAALLASIVFLETNGRVFTASEADAANMFLALAAGEVEEAEFALWLRDNSAPRA
jgi:death-on-curing protein